MIRFSRKQSALSGASSADAPLPQDVVYSFDVFDTCISRTHAYPRDLFYALGLKLAPTHLPQAQAADFARDFQARRIRAEKRAHRDARPHECADIAQIYERFEAPAGLGLSIAELIAAEIELEERSIYPVKSMVAHIDRLREAGHRIVFISDMYLPASTLEPLLRGLGVMRERDRLYVSCDVRLTKHTGNLYRHVLQQEGLRPEQLVHTGDNTWADVRKARDSGVAARHFAPGLLTPHEATIAGRRLPRAAGRTFLPALSRRTRLAVREDPEGDHYPLEELIHSTIAPFLIAYVEWVLEDARRQGLDRLYFVARDGEVLHRIAEALSPEGQGPELRYLHGSRRAWLAPSIRPDASGWERLLVTTGHSNSRQDILTRAGLDEDDQSIIRGVLECDPAIWTRPLAPDEAHAFVKRMIRSPAASDIVFRSAEMKRETALAYFEQQGLLDEARWALVDAGWSLNCQAALKRILGTRDAAVIPQGYYIALTRDHLPAEEAGIARAFIPKAGSVFSRRRVIIEHCFTASTHSTTRAYAKEGAVAAPAFGTELRGDEELAYAHRLHEAASAMAELVASDPAMLGELRRHRNEIVANAERFLRHPRRSDALAMASFGTVADLRHERAFVQPLCRPLRVADLVAIIGMTISPQRNFGSPSFMWLEGSNALSPMYVRIPIAAMLAIDSLRTRLESRR